MRSDFIFQASTQLCHRCTMQMANQWLISEENRDHAKSGLMSTSCLGACWHDLNTISVGKYVLSCRAAVLVPQLCITFPCKSFMFHSCGVKCLFFLFCFNSVFIRVLAAVFALRAEALEPLSVGHPCCILNMCFCAQRQVGIIKMSSLIIAHFKSLKPRNKKRKKSRKKAVINPPY